MKTIKVAEATERQLDWLAAKCLGEREDETLDPLTWLYTAKPTGCWDFCTNWVLGGQILERENISVGYQGHLGVPLDSLWYATNRVDACGFGQKPLIAAIRCYVASKLGDTVEVPEELTCSPTPKND